MNIRRLSIFLLITMMLVPIDVSAHCKGKHTGNHPHCSGGGGGGGSDTNVPFAVAVVQHLNVSESSTLYAPATADSTCFAQAASIRHLWATFPRHDLCATLTTTIAASIADDVVIKVETDKSGNVVSVIATGQDTIGSEGIYHQSNVITGIFSVDTNSDGSFLIHVHADGVPLWKCDTHVLKKKTTCTENVGYFSLHDMVYTPDP